MLMFLLQKQPSWHLPKTPTMVWGHTLTTLTFCGFVFFERISGLYIRVFNRDFCCCCFVFEKRTYEIYSVWNRYVGTLPFDRREQGVFPGLVPQEEGHGQWIIPVKPPRGEIEFSFSLSPAQGSPWFLHPSHICKIQHWLPCVRGKETFPSF